jgi:hypothetical protein
MDRKRKRRRERKRKKSNKLLIESDMGVVNGVVGFLSVGKVWVNWWDGNARL